VRGCAWICACRNGVCVLGIGLNHGKHAGTVRQIMAVAGEPSEPRVGYARRVFDNPLVFSKVKRFRGARTLADKFRKRSPAGP